MNLFEFDNSFECELLCGVDEAGRGPLAGDVYAAAVILPKDVVIEGLDDSKKLSEKKREALFEEIIKIASAYHIATATVAEIDEHNILNATFIAMKRAVEGLKIKPNMALIDGNKNPELSVHTKCVVKGDSKSASIAAASILAKVSRDRYMAQVAVDYPQYAFEKHKGYGTKLHYEMLDKYGQADVHRTSFLKKYYAQKLGEIKPTAKRKVGDDGENATANQLIESGYDILERNYICTHGEIDIIAKKGGIIAFIEVKTRRKNAMVKSEYSVGSTKQNKIMKSALQYIEENDIDLQPRFDVSCVEKNGTNLSVDYIENAFCAKY